MNSDGDVTSYPSDTAAEKAQMLLADALSYSSPRLLTFDSIVAGVVISVIGWTTLYYLFGTYSPHHTSEWNCRWVTVLHAITVVILSGWSVFVQGPWPFTHPGNVSLFLVVHACQQAVMGKYFCAYLYLGL